MHRIFVVMILVASLGLAQRRSSSPPVAQDMPAYSLHMIGHAHIDLAYRWRWNEVVHRVGPDTFRGVLRMMDQEPGLTFAQSQMVLYEAVQKEYPDLFQAIRKRIAEGRWVVVGGMWAEPDMIIPSGESFVRQFLLGKQYARRELGVDVKVGWTPDAFCGQVNTLPQILKGAGMDYYIFGRGQPPGQRMFWWEGPDGSRIPAMGVFATYSAPPLTGRMFPMLVEFCNRAPGSKSVLVLYGRGDHGGGPREEDVAAIHAIQHAAGMPKVVYDTPQHFLDTVVAPLKGDLPVYKESLGGMEGISYVSQARAKLGNRRSENLLLTAEEFNTIGTFYQRKPNYPRVDFNAVWKPVLRNQFHDVLAGTTNGRVYDDDDAEYAEVYREGRELLAQGLEYIGARIDTRGGGIPLIVYNPVSWTRSDVVEVEIRFTRPVAEFALRDPEKQRCPLPGD